MIGYDTVYLHVLKGWQEGQLNLVHDTKNAKGKLIKNKNRVA